MFKMNALGWVSLVLVLIGALNWGLVGIFDFDLVAAIFGKMTYLSRIIYAVVGVAAIYILLTAAAGTGTSGTETGS